MEKFSKQRIIKANANCGFHKNPYLDSNPLRALIFAKAIRKGDKITIRSNARIEYRAAGGHNGAYRLTENVDAIITKTSIDYLGTFSNSRGYIPTAYITATDSDGKQYSINLSICKYSHIDFAEKNDLEQYPIYPIALNRN